MARRGRKRDFLIIAAVVFGAFGALYLYSGVWPPIVVVESNSMMHVDRFEYVSGTGSAHGNDVGFGRFKTMDPGDIVLVRDVDSIEDVDTFARKDGWHYGWWGDVVAYQRPGDDSGVTIIHRALTYVTVQGQGASASYRVWWSESWQERGTCVQHPIHTCVFGAEGVTINELGITRKTFRYSGFITKGDNGVSNAGADQAGSDPLMPQPVRLEDLVGKAQLEVPAVGALRLAFSGDTIKNAEMQGHRYFLRIGNMVAPTDIWMIAGLEVTALVLAPFFVAMVRDYFDKPSREVVAELAVLERAYNEVRKGAERR